MKIDVRVPDDLLTRFDDWRERQEFPLTRSAAIRQAMEMLLTYSIRVSSRQGRASRPA